MLTEERLLVLIRHVATAEVGRRIRSRHVVEAHHLRASGRDGEEFRGIRRGCGLREEEAVIDAVRLERGGERVGVGRRVGGDCRHFLPRRPGVLAGVAVRRAGSDVELVRGTVGVREGERDGIGRCRRHGHGTREAERGRFVHHAAKAALRHLGARLERRLGLVLVEHVVHLVVEADVTCRVGRRHEVAGWRVVGGYLHAIEREGA